MAVMKLTTGTYMLARCSKRKLTWSGRRCCICTPRSKTSSHKVCSRPSWERVHGKAYKKLRSQRGQALARMLEGAGSLGIRYEAELRRDHRDHPAENADKLRELNTLRNRCSHNWLLDVPIRRKRKPSQPKLMLLNFRGRSLYKVETLEEFMAEFGHLYYFIYGTVTKEARMAAAQYSRHAGDEINEPERQEH